MSYLTLPFVINNTVALVVGTATVTLIPAPGVGSRLRIVFMNVGITRSATGIVDIRLIGLVSSNFFLEALGLAVNGTSTIIANAPEPGFQLGDNEGLQLSAISTAATGNASAMVAYYVDSVT